MYWLGIAHQYQLKDLILFWYFLELLAVLILVQRENGQNQAHIFRDTCSESSQVNYLIIMYCFERTNHDFLLNFLFQGDPNLFSRSHILDQQYLTCLSDCKNLLFQAMMFIEFFPIIQIIIRVNIFSQQWKKLIVVVVVRKSVWIKKLLL